MPSSRWRLAANFGGPNFGISGLRKICGAGKRALTCAALKPQGLPPEELGALAGRLAAGGIDFIKDDHGLADQSYSRFAERVRACAGAVCHASDDTGLLTSYVPNISGDLNLAAAQIGLAMEEGLEAVMVEPMILGLSNFNRLVRDFPGMAFFAHPAMAGAARIAPPLLLGKLFRMFGADATIFPNHGGRFSYSPGNLHGHRGRSAAPLAGAQAHHALPGRRHDARPRARNSGLLRPGHHAADRRQPACGGRPAHGGGRGVAGARRPAISKEPPMPEDFESSGSRTDGFRWEGVELLAYKDEGSAPFKAITRQVLFGRPELGCELRYFEMRAGRAFDAGAARACPCGDDLPGPRHLPRRRPRCARWPRQTSCSFRR